MESRNEIHIDSENLRKVTTAFKDKLSAELVDPLNTVLEQHKDGLKPLTGYYLSAKKGDKKQLFKKIAMDVVARLLEVFVANYMETMIESKDLQNALSDIDESIDDRHDGTNFYLPESLNPLTGHKTGITDLTYGLNIGIDSKGNPRIDFTAYYVKEFFVKFVIKQGVSTPIQKKIKFRAEFGGGFYDMLIKNAASSNRSLTLGELGGELIIYLSELPFTDFKINQRLFDKYIGVPLDDIILPIPRLIMN